MNKNTRIIIERRSLISKPMIIMLIFITLLFGGIWGYKMIEGHMIKKHMSALALAPVTVSATNITLSSWKPKLTATGSLRAINGVDVTTEIAGLVKAIRFVPGSEVKAGDIIVELNADVEIAQLESLVAQAQLAHVNFTRDKKQFEIEGVSQAMVDADAANLKSSNAQAAQQAAINAQKIIRAPFNGRLGISAINLGQYLKPGDKIVTLQSLNPIYVDFYLPQQNLPQLAIDQPISLSTDTYPGISFKGKITTISPKIDPTTRNIEVEATLENDDYKLLPGMYGVVEISTGMAQEYLTLPQTAVSYNPYGDLVYILKEKEKDKEGNTLFIASQKFITVGETRGDQVQILKGLQKGDLVVTSGQLKLKNGSLVMLNNAIVPANNSAVSVENE